ncbi:BamA/TamA family outer membrane protein [Shimia sediminis]|uniref:BamA/TamA family outer membrane protein n=1 Tax=Shimia sediminis TaxID=2497945 RepID=UPI000F8CDE21|nr:BamA/TamA family outer membrane protein [Shimia sediminis]
MRLWRPETLSRLCPASALAAGRTLVVASLIGFGPTFSLADNAGNEALDILEDLEEVTETDFGIREGSFVVAPIPFRNPIFGTGLALGLGYLYQTDENSNTSILGVGALGSDNGTEGYGASASLAWDNNRWQLNLLAMEGDLNYDLYVAGIPLPVRQTGTVASGSFLYGVTSELSFGVSFRYFDTRITELSGAVLPPGIRSALALEIANFGLVAKWDTRSDSLYPRDGHLLDFEIIGGTEVSGPSRDYSKSFVNYSHYHSISERTVLAARASACVASDETPFFDLCSLGGTDGFRGFPATQYYDEALASGQIEVRQQLSDRFRAVAFAGIGVTGADFGDFSSDGVHVAGGVGLRFKLSRKFDADFSVDVAYNDEDDETIYIYVGQRF